MLKMVVLIVGTQIYPIHYLGVLLFFIFLYMCVVVIWVKVYFVKQKIKNKENKEEKWHDFEIFGRKEKWDLIRKQRI